MCSIAQGHCWTFYIHKVLIYKGYYAMLLLLSQYQC